MNVLWITNILLSPVTEYLNLKSNVMRGWMFSSLNSMKNIDSTINFSVATFYSGNAFLEKVIDNVTYYCLPLTELDNSSKYWKYINNQCNPDVVHIHGTEYPYGLKYIECCGTKNVVVSIQGLVSIYQRYLLGGISEKDIRSNISVRERILCQNPVKNIANSLDNKRVKNEIKYISSVQHVIGRTTWDKNHALYINPKIEYHFCNETLRSAFYSRKWKLEECKKFTIYVSQGTRPLKGLHNMIKALRSVLNFYPKTKLMVAGPNILFPKWYRKSTYANYIYKLIEDNDLKKQIIFTGPLAAPEVVKKLLSSNLYVNPSAIENSPNSLGEAQILGVPCISSNVGGVSDMVKDNYSGMLYRYEEYEILSLLICKLFKENDLAQKISRNGIDTAEQRHDRIANAKKTISIYKQIVEEH